MPSLGPAAPCGRCAAMTHDLCGPHSTQCEATQFETGRPLMPLHWTDWEGAIMHAQARLQWLVRRPHVRQLTEF